MMSGIARKVQERGVLGSALLCLRMPFSPFLQSDLGTLVSRAYHDWTFDRTFGVDTAGFIEQPNPSLSNCAAEMGRPYDGSNPAHFKQIIQGLGITYDDFSFVDFGSGKGRVLMMASSFPFHSVSGVEWSADLHSIAARNIDSYRGPRACEEVTSHCGDAREFPIPSGRCVLYFFNPFKDEIMGRVIENIKASFEAGPREIVIIYVNPKSRAIFDTAQFLENISDHGWYAVYRTRMAHAQ